MTEQQFTPSAALLWGAIPAEARAQILGNVFCGHCGGITTIKAFSGEEEHRNLILKGFCAKCGQKVARVVETPEASRSHN